ncbi:MAG: leucyl/phenylalanyl-tRNA--protein transferase [Proteobacteria bacterium]|nr:leucyl/phenylalanyl-tRNA--protein transferase [Pseudomonadota bacterium]
MAGSDSDFPVTPEILLRAYASGIFPMAESAEDPGLHWLEPHKRGILPLDAFHVPEKLAKFVRRNPYRIVVDRDFSAVIDSCAAPRGASNETWINAHIRRLYGALYEMGFCHTIEVYDGEKLVGGLYGIALGGAFFGESMFHRARDCSKLALVHLVARLKAGGFVLLDTQFVTDHLRQFGAVEIPRRDYRKRLESALATEANFHVWPADFQADAMAVLEANAPSE